MRFRKSSHSVYNTQYHIVWTPRYRRKILVKGVKEYLEKMLTHLADLDEDIEVRKVNAQIDHVHMVIVIPPRLSVASVVQFMKSRTGKKLKEKYGYMRKVFWKSPGVWSKGYCVTTVGLNEKQILDYVQYQEKEDKGQLEIEWD